AHLCSAGGAAGGVARDAAEVYVEERARQHAEAREQRVAEAHAREPERVVQEREGDGGREPQQEGDLPTLAPDGPVDRGELGVAGDAALDGAARQVAGDQ